MQAVGKDAEIQEIFHASLLDNGILTGTNELYLTSYILCLKIIISTLQKEELQFPKI